MRQIDDLARACTRVKLSTEAADRLFQLRSDVAGLEQKNETRTLPFKDNFVLATHLGCELSNRDSASNALEFQPTPQTGSLQTPHAAPDESVPEATIATPEPVKIPAPAPPQRVLPESILSAPQKESVAPAIKYDTVLTKRSVLIAAHSGWQYRNNRQSQIVGFEFSNHGGNQILPPRYDSSKDQLYTRDFQFRFDDRARQDVHLSITDWVASRNKQFRLSELMNSIMLFFPRNYLPAVVTVGDRNILTLPTGEEVEFNAATHEVSGGVFSESARRSQS